MSQQRLTPMEVLQGRRIAYEMQENELPVHAVTGSKPDIKNFGNQGKLEAERCSFCHRLTFEYEYINIKTRHSLEKDIAVKACLRCREKMGNKAIIVI